MPFQDDPSIRPLYDTLDGGAPEAWRCLLTIHLGVAAPHKNSPLCCQRITKTLEGMRLHQERVHGYTPQDKISYSKDTVASGDPQRIIGHHEAKTPTD